MGACLTPPTAPQLPVLSAARRRRPSRPRQRRTRSAAGRSLSERGQAINATLDVMGAVKPATSRRDPGRRHSLVSDDGTAEGSPALRFLHSGDNDNAKMHRGHRNPERCQSARLRCACLRDRSDDAAALPRIRGRRRRSAAVAARRCAVRREHTQSPPGYSPRSPPIRTTGKLVAHNYDFERNIYANVLVPRYGFPPLPSHVQHCTQRLALANAYPAELDLLAQALGLPYRKDPAARKAMLRGLASARQPQAQGQHDPDVG